MHAGMEKELNIDVVVGCRWFYVRKFMYFHLLIAEINSIHNSHFFLPALATLSKCFVEQKFPCYKKLIINSGMLLL